MFMAEHDVPSNLPSWWRSRILDAILIWNILMLGLFAIADNRRGNGLNVTLLALIGFMCFGLVIRRLQLRESHVSTAREEKEAS
jgi:hypothetical protein